MARTVLHSRASTKANAHKASATTRSRLGFNWAFLDCPNGRPQTARNICLVKHSRRIMLQAIVALSLSNVTVPSVLAAEKNTSKREDKAKKSFAEVMQNGMKQYEANIATLKEELFGEISSSDVVLDMGIGTGPNLQYMPKETRVIGVDPNPYMKPYALEKAQKYGVTLKFVEGVGEHLPLEDSSCDFVVCTLTLCSVPNPRAAINEILRVLKPEGRYIFIEHVRAPRSRPLFRAVQAILDPVQVAAADGCHLNRDTAMLIQNNPGFREVNLREFDARFGFIGNILSPIRPHIAGYAVKENL